MKYATRKTIATALKASGRGDLATALIGKKPRKRRRVKAKTPPNAKPQTYRQKLDAIKATAECATPHTKASAILAVYRQLSDENRKKFLSMPLKTMATTASRIISKRMAENRKRTMAKLAKKSRKLKVKAASDWDDVAAAELAAETQNDPEDADVTSRGDYVEVSFGREEYMVFEDYDEAESYCKEYLSDSISDEPEIYGTDFLQMFITVTPTDIRLIANEEADSRLQDIEYDIDRENFDNVMMQADLENEWEDLIDEEDEITDQIDTTDDPKEEKKLQKQLQKITKQKEALIEKARDKIAEDIIDDVSDRLKKDPVGWWEDMGGDLRDSIPNWMSVDYDEAADYIIRSDGVAHILAGYDGNELELPSGAYAYRIN